MSNNTTITVVGNLTADPELRFTPSGAAVTNFTVASTPKKFNKQTSAFEDGETLFMRCSVWREPAENVAESLNRGDRVVVTGELVSRSWQTDAGENRTVMEMRVDEIGPSLRYATAKVTKAERQQGGSFGGNQQTSNGSATFNPQQAQQTGNGWGGQTEQTDPWNPGGQTEQAPF